MYSYENTSYLVTLLNRFNLDYVHVFEMISEKEKEKRKKKRKWREISSNRRERKIIKKDEKRKRVYKKFNLTFFYLFLNPRNTYILKNNRIQRGGGGGYDSMKRWEWNDPCIKRNKLKYCNLYMMKRNYYYVMLNNYYVMIFKYNNAMSINMQSQ